SGYLAAFPATVFDWVEGKSANNDGIVVPYYTVHKIMAGLLDAYRYLGNQQALEVASKMADYFQARLAALSSDQIEKTFRTDGSKNPQNEFGAMSDVLSELSADTGEQKYLETAKIFNRSWFMTPLAAGEDRLQGLHGNTHVAEALGIAHTANLSGDSTSIEASENFWKLVTEQHSFVIGGNSFHEWLDKGGVEAGPSIDDGKVLPATTAETCNSHNMLKLTNTLFERSPRIDYADYYERTLYNHILATIAPDTGQMTYFTPMYGHFRTYMNGTYCCTGTGIENTPRYNEGIYFKSGNSLWINLYIPSEMTWEETGLTIRQEGNAAAGEPVTITVAEGGAATQATLNLRIPFWVSGQPTLTVNGSPVEPSPDASTYVPVSRAWNVGDVIALTLPTSLRLEHAKDVSSMVSVFYGPILLAGELGSANMPNDFADKDAYLSTAPATVPKIASTSTDPADWLEPVAGAALAFEAHDAGAATGITFRPLYDVHHERYSVYWPLEAPAQ
ncbi:MAG: glycoside hydrolase family 127 protein, partial [Polyangiaceae bacterium]|nr:glycoside hydrolase family 127 protein [Polyangiaceae bacterium]